jgi:hypothetical protein
MVDASYASSTEMPRDETRFSLLMMSLGAALFGATRIHAETLTSVLLIVLPLVFLAHIRVADTSNRMIGPVWLRRAQWALIGGALLVSFVVLRVL